MLASDLFSRLRKSPAIPERRPLQGHADGQPARYESPGNAINSRTDQAQPTQGITNSGYIRPVQRLDALEKGRAGNRVVWASFEYDCTLSTLTNRRGAVDLAELPTRLPCPEAVWEAPSAPAWNALRTHHSDRTMNASLPEALQKTLAAGVLPEQNTDLPPWGKRLCAQVIGRLLWDLKQLQIMSMSDFLGMKSLFAAQRQTKSALLHGLDKLADSMNTPGSIAELINYK